MYRPKNVMGREAYREMRKYFPLLTWCLDEIVRDIGHRFPDKKHLLEDLLLLTEVLSQIKRNVSEQLVLIERAEELGIDFLGATPAIRRILETIKREVEDYEDIVVKWLKSKIL